MSTDFNSKEYYNNIRKALVAGYFMQVSRVLQAHDVLRLMCAAAALYCAFVSAGREGMVLAAGMQLLCVRGGVGGSDSGGGVRHGP